MATETQIDNPISVTTPLGPNKLLVTAFSGHEGLSQLFCFQLDMIAENESQVPFDQLLGQNLTVTLVLPENKKRFFSGVCCRV